MKNIFLIVILNLVCGYSLFATVWTVGPSSKYKFCSEISGLTRDNDTIDIEAVVYQNDLQVTWVNNNLLIRGINGKPMLLAGDKIANDHSNGKGIFVVKGNNTVIENIDFRFAAVPDHNGAGIRQEGSNLTVRSCDFIGNEMGILQGGTISNCTVLIEYCNFENNGSTDNPGYQHNIYINHIDTLIFRFNSTMDAIAAGHELKSRANYNFIEYNRISNISSKDSRNIDLPNGGTAVIIGNIIEQGENSENSNIIGYAMEGATNPVAHNLFVVNNTIVNYKTKGNFISLKNADTLFMKNNICVGAQTGGFIIGDYKALDTSHNYINTNLDNNVFVVKNVYDYQLEKDSPAINAGLAINRSVFGHSLTPEFELILWNGIQARPKNGVIDLGAIEYNIPSVVEREHQYAPVAPNPASEYIIINLDKRALDNMYITPEIKLFNAFGERLTAEATYPTNSTIRLNIDRLSAGLYFVAIGNVTSRFVVER